MGYKIREAQVKKIPYMLVIGDREVDSGLVAIRHRDQGDLGTDAIVNFIKKLKEEITEKTI